MALEGGVAPMERRAASAEALELSICPRLCGVWGSGLTARDPGFRRAAWADGRVGEAKGELRGTGGGAMQTAFSSAPPSAVAPATWLSAWPDPAEK